MRNLYHIVVVVSVMLYHGFAFGQSRPAQEWFNQAAREYVKQDRITALRTLDKGLSEHPADPSMLKLAEELLKDEQEQQDKEQQQQQDQQKKEQEQKEQEQEEQGKDEGQEEQGDEKDEEKEQQKEEGKEKEQEERERQQEQQKEQRKEEQARPMQMTPQDAKRILDALERQEGEVQEKARERLQPAVRTPIEKDW